MSLNLADLKKVGRPAILMCFVPACIEMIGTIPMAMGLECGNIVLTVAVVSILITAPFGAICIDRLYKKLLEVTYE